jgi:hypothetical protein
MLLSRELSLPFDSISLEMIYRGLYHFSVARQKGQATDKREVFCCIRKSRYAVLLNNNIVLERRLHRCQCYAGRSREVQYGSRAIAQSAVSECDGAERPLRDRFIVPLGNLDSKTQTHLNVTVTSTTGAKIKLPIHS